MREIPAAVKLALLGAVGFWLPDVAVHTWAGRSFDSSHVRFITVMLPLTFLTSYLVVRRLAAKRSYRHVGLTMVLGVWLLGGMFMTIAATAGGGGFVGPDGFRGGVFVMMLGAIPIYTFIMATYDGSLLALLIVTFGALLTWGLWLSGMPLPFVRRHR